MNVFDEPEAVVIGGRRAGDGFVRLSIFTRELLALSVEAGGGRASTLLLTSAQIDELRFSLARLAARLDAANHGDGIVPTADAAHSGQDSGDAWNGHERRHENEA